MSLKLIGFYPSEDQAKHAREDLGRAGFGWSAIHLHRGEDGRQASNALDRKVAMEAARQHATALLLDADEKVSGRAMHILRRHHPVAMARANWPAAEWKESAQPRRREEPEKSGPAEKNPSPFAEAPRDDHAEVIFSARRFVAEIAGDQRFRGREWHDIEPFVQREFERQYPNQSWAEHLPAIMVGYARERQ